MFHYDETTGSITWRVSPTSRVAIGDRVGTASGKGYFRTRIDGVNYAVHRVIWLHVYGRWPNGEIDHINGIHGDNRLVNLREVASLLNQQNKRHARADSKTGVLGVYRVGRRFRATIQSNRKTVSLGTFPTVEDAHLAYVSAKRQMHEGCTI
jgi:hypothetical protein